jgi:16S rRNA (cytidine1402-2'-O)-methyltransferase
VTRAQVSVGRLVVCPTPIGNLQDITLRALERLREADLIACEDTRHTRMLLDRFDIQTKLVSFHEHNEAVRARELVGRIGEGTSVALVCDAGMPLISDPGYALVRACLQAGLPVEVLPGASAPLVALVASGLPAERFCFAGFLPRRESDRKRVLLDAPHTLIAFESPRRLLASLKLLAEHDPGRRVAVCRELTKVHEQILRGTAAELADRLNTQPPRGEVVLVVEGSVTRAGDHQRAVQAMGELVRAGARPRAAARVLAALTGVSANELYRSQAGTPEDLSR